MKVLYKGTIHPPYEIRGMNKAFKFELIDTGYLSEDMPEEEAKRFASIKVYSIVEDKPVEEAPIKETVTAKPVSGKVAK